MARDEEYYRIEAEKRIERVRSLNSTELNLRGMKLTQLPDSIRQFKQLHSLDISGNQLELLPDWLGQFTQIQHLNLGSNLLAEIPEWLGQLSNLWVLKLFNNRLIELPKELRILTKLEELNLSKNQLLALPEWLGQLTNLKDFFLYQSNLTVLPKWFTKLKDLRSLNLGNNDLTTLPEWVGDFTELQALDLSGNRLTSLPETLGNLGKLRRLNISNNQLTALPESIINLTELRNLTLRKNPFNSELAEAVNEGIPAVKAYLRAKAEAQITLNETKLILVGEGEVGKTCLMDALEGKPWEEHPTTHGIEIRSILVTNPTSKTELTLNGWDFGGQRVYRPTHQLFFSSPAVYLVVWKPREGFKQNFVQEWIQLVKRREPGAKILVVATHCGFHQRQPDIDRQELWDIFGKDTVVNFFFVDNKPDVHGQRKGIAELKEAIAHVAATLPEVGRSVPKSFADVRAALQVTGAPYLPFNEVLAICRAHNMDDEIARLFITISHRLGHLTHYENDPALRDIVILRPDWLATAMSYVLDDEETRKAHGLVDFSRLSYLWNDPTRPTDTRYPDSLHRVFLRLMERFDLSYRVAGLSKDEDSNPVSLIAQLVPDTTPEEGDLNKGWRPEISSGDIQQTQICRIVDDKGNSANAEGLFFQLIVRLHKFSLGRTHYNDSVHWQRGLVLDDEYNGRALLRHVGNDVHITVRAPYPEFFLAMLTREVKYLVESFWEGLQCDVMVPCIEPCGRKAVGTGLYEVEKLIDSKRKGRLEFPCPVCNEWQNIDSLLRNAPAAQPDATTLVFSEFIEVKAELAKAREQLTYQGEKIMGRFDRLDDRQRRILSRVDKAYTDLLQVFTDEAKEGPRLFSLVPVDRSNYNPREWLRAKFRLTLWCEHSRLPLPALNGADSSKGVYEMDLTRDWFKKVNPYLKLLTGTLSLVLPIASSAVKLAIDDAAYKAIEEQLDFGKSIVDAAISEGGKVGEFFGAADTIALEHGEMVHAQGATLHELHMWLKAKDPGFGGLVRVLNKRQEFLWVHEQFAGEY